jgi:hypothetical protein
MDSRPHIQPEALAVCRRVEEARRARQAAREKRLLAAERAMRLEMRLKDAEEAALRAEIARRLAARRRLLAVQKVTVETQAQRRTAQDSMHGLTAPAARPPGRTAFTRYAGVAALGLLIGTAATVLTLYAPDPADSRELAAHSIFSVAPGEGLKLALSSTLREPAPR